MFFVITAYSLWLSAHHFWLEVNAATGFGDETPTSHDFYDFPGVIDTIYSQPGDINIGVNVFVTVESETYPAGACASPITKPHFTVQISEAIAFATDLINRDPDLLPNVTFGFAIRGSCSSVGVTIATSLSFLPQNLRTASTGDNSVSSSSPPASTLSYNESSTMKQDLDVIGIVSQGFSSLTTPVSSLYSVAHLPIVGPIESSDELSNKDDHPYFFRVSPPDVYKVEAMLNFVSSNGWSYISVLYVDGSFGQNAFDNVNLMADRYGICIATSHRLLFSTDYQAVVRDLLVHSRARVVLLFLYLEQFEKLLRVIVDQNATGHFIWVGTGGLVNYRGQQYPGVTSDPGLGTFTVETYSVEVPDFYNYLKKQTLSSSKNPWMEAAWESVFDCSFKEGNCDNDTNVLESPTHLNFPSTAGHIDAVLTFAHAAHHLIAERCPNARGKEARACITGELLREYLKNTNFEGFLGRVKFDENQELKSGYIISQLQGFSSTKVSASELEFATNLYPVKIGLHNITTEKLEFFNRSIIMWSNLKSFDRIFPYIEAEDSLPIDVPESVCSGPCSVGEYRIEKEVPCCWECRRCRDNERLVDGSTNCELCPSFTWPDPSTGFTTCIEIPPTYPTLEDTIPIVLTSLTVLALAFYTFTLIGYLFYRNERVIKASSRELSVMQLLAILAGYLNILLFQMKPTAIICSVIYFLFCLSFVLLYAPLLVKTVRIFRIFQSGKSNNRQLRFISPESQIFISGCLITVQIAICVATFVLFTPGAKFTQPIWSEKLVELSCDLTLPGLASFLSYNIVLVCLCSVFAFKVRKLPDNFNESQFIAMCVATTLLIWLAFIPTYFTANREYVRVFLLSTALLLNHSVALIFLFTPKIYAAVFLSGQESGRVTDSKLSS